MPTLTLNGQAISFTPGETILQVAQQNGVRIPTLCNHPDLKPAGMCRMCLVEVEGQRGYLTACTTAAVDGMAVHSDTPALLDLRREILSLILSEHPYTCLVCDRHDRCNEWQTTIRKAAVTTGCENCPKNGQCELQSLVDEVGLSLMPYCISYRGLPVAKEDPFFDRDYNLCILCGRCVRVCQDVRHTSTLAFMQRGLETVVGTAYGQSHLDTDCEFCGACVDICPTGALFDKRTKWEGVPEEKVHTVCPYCSVGCELDLWVKRGRSPMVMGVRPSADGVANRGQACVRGRFGVVEMIHSPDRLRSPLLRKEGRLAESTWEEAIAFLAEKLPAYRGDAFAMLLSPHLTTESAYVLQKFARQGMGSQKVDITTGIPRIPQIAELVNLWESRQSAPIRSILDAGCILTLGTNPRLSHPIVGMYIRQAQARGAKLIVVDPRHTELAKRADLWLQVEAGTDEAWIRELIGKVGAGLHPPHMSHAELGAGSQLARVAQLLVQNGPVVIIYGSGITYYPSAPDTLRALYDLADALEPEAGVLPLLGAANLRGVLQVDALAYHRDNNTTQIMQDIQAGSIKALYLTGEAPMLQSVPASESLSRLELLVVQDSFISPHVAQAAHVVLPAASFAEVSGTLTNLEGRHQYFEPAIPPVGNARPDWWIACQLAQAMGIEGFQFEKSVEVWEAIIAGERGDGHGMRGALRVEDGKPQGANGTWQEARANTQPTKQEPFSPTTSNSQSPVIHLLVERNQFSYRGSALTARVHGMEQYKSDEGAVQLHPADAASLGLQDGEQVRVISAYGSDLLRLRITPDLPLGTAFTSINAAIGSPLFPGRLPEVKAYAVKFEKSD